MSNEPITIYKLIILYMLDKVETPLTSQIVSNYIIDKGYTNYFNVQTAFSELLEAELISLDTTYKTSYYTLTAQGEETLNLFHRQLSSEIRQEIVQYLEENRYTIREEVACITDYNRLETGEYLTKLVLRDGANPLLQIDLSVTTEEEAITICNSFKKKKEELYQHLIKSLLQ